MKESKLECFPRKTKCCVLQLPRPEGSALSARGKFSSFPVFHNGKKKASLLCLYLLLEKIIEVKNPRGYHQNAK